MHNLVKVISCISQFFILYTQISPDISLIRFYINADIPASAKDAGIFASAFIIFHFYNSHHTACASGLFKIKTAFQFSDIQLSHSAEHCVSPHNIADLHRAVSVLFIIAERNRCKLISVEFLTDNS